MTSTTRNILWSVLAAVLLVAALDATYLLGYRQGSREASSYMPDVRVEMTTAGPRVVTYPPLRKLLDVRRSLHKNVVSINITSTNKWFAADTPTLRPVSFR